jgi:DNA-directed RNA polymerase specialized sigma24 family protein
MKFEELFQHLVDPSSPQHQDAWREFMHRYRKILENNIAWRCRRWNSRALKKQINDVVDDVLGRVLNILCRNNFRALKNYQNKDNEAKFKSYLRIIANNATSKYLKDNYSGKETSESDIFRDESSFIDTLRGMEDDARWETYEYFVNKIYSRVKRKRGNLERDVHMFWLYVWGDFDKETIVTFPCLQGSGDPHNVDNVVNRIKDLLRKNNHK